MKPACHNRAPFGPGYWHNTGRQALSPHHDNRFGYGFRMLKPIYRWIEHRFEDRCGTWLGTGIGPNNEPYPQAKGWDCTGCRLDPHRVIHSDADLKPYNETIEVDQLRGNGYMRNQHGTPMAKMRVTNLQSRQQGRREAHRAWLVKFWAENIMPFLPEAPAQEDTKPWSIGDEVAKNCERMVPRDKVHPYPHTDDVPPGWNDHLVDVRKELVNRAIEFNRRTGRPVRLMCGDVEVGRVP